MLAKLKTGQGHLPPEIWLGEIPTVWRRRGKFLCNRPLELATVHLFGWKIFPKTHAFFLVPQQEVGTELQTEEGHIYIYVSVISSHSSCTAEQSKDYKKIKECYFVHVIIQIQIIAYVFYVNIFEDTILLQW